MSEYKSEGSIELEVTDFGPIIEATVDLRPLTVFVGPSNTGKSWMATLTYALHRHFSRELRHQRDGMHTGINLSNEQANTHLDWAQRELVANREYALVQRDQQSSEHKTFVMPEQFVEVVQSICNGQGAPLSEEICRCFGVDSTGKLIRKAGRNGARVTLRPQITGNGMPFEHGLTITSDTTELSAKVPEGIEMRADLYFQIKDEFTHLLRIIQDKSIDKYREVQFLCRRLLGFVTASTLPHLFGPLHLPAYYLPAERTGLMQAYSVVVSALIKSEAMPGIPSDVSTPNLTGIQADFLDQLLKFDQSKLIVTKFSPEPATGIEDTILGGTIHTDRAEITGYPSFSYQPQGWKNRLPLIQSSSMVSDLAPVVLYLHHRIKTGDVLIIEEPESSLHPGMQVEFTRQLAALVKSGVRIIITTHSECVLEELANIVRRSRLPSGERDKLEHGDYALRPEQVGAWLFKKKNRPKGSVVEEVKLDDETGLYPTDYDEVSESLYNESVNISNRIQDIKHE